MTSTPEPQPRKLGKYEVRREVGRGGMSIVYEGFDPLISRRVALKTFLTGPQEGGASDGLLARMRREAQAAGRLSHPHIVAVYDYGEESLADASGVVRSSAYIAMEYIDGRSLDSYLASQERFALPQTLRIMSQLLDALGYSHSHGVVHRDIKPANIMLLPDGTVKVADFGIARIESSTLTQMGTVLGSPAYMSPEQFMGQTVDARSDLYSAGVVLYQLLTGELPFSGSFSTVMHRVLNEQASPPSALNVQVSTSLDPIVRKAMAKRPEERYQSASEFQEALERAGTTGSDARSAAQSSDDKTQLRSAATDSSGARGRAPHRVAVIGLAGLSCLAALGAVWFLLAHPARGPGRAASGEPATPQAKAAAPAPALLEPPADGKSALISALGIIHPSAGEQERDGTATEHALWGEARRQLIAKAAALYVQPRSLHANYDLLRSRLLAQPDQFITAVLRQGQPETVQDGSIVGTLWAAVSVRDVQKALNQISHDERVEFIRNHGDPRIAVSIRVFDPSQSSADGAQRSAVAENILKDRIRSFGFEIVDREQARPPADFYVDGEVRFKKLSARLAASGLTIEKYVLTSWTVKAVDATSGEEVYHNTKIPQRQSWATQELALADIGNLIGGEFSPTFFLQYFDFRPMRVRLRFTALPPDLSSRVLDEINGNLNVLSAVLVPASSDVLFDAQLSASDEGAAHLVLQSIVAPLNAKIGTSCFSLASGDGPNYTVAFDAVCRTADRIRRLQKAPPEPLAGLTAASI